MELSVIMPAFNEAERVAVTLAETAGVLRACSPAWELILVDDGSEDDTYGEARRAQRSIPELSVLRYVVNRGKGCALRLGAAAARGDLVAFLDADLELHPSQLPLLLGVLRDAQADVVVGSKRRPGARVGFPAVRRVLSESYLRLVDALFGLPVRDTQTGLKVFRRAALLDALRHVGGERFVFDLELLLELRRKGYRMAEAPVVARFVRTSSRLTPADIWGMWAGTLELASRDGMGRRWGRARIPRPAGGTGPAGFPRVVLRRRLKTGGLRHMQSDVPRPF